MRNMKNSGVEWLGEIPKHWNTTRIKNLFELRNERNYKALEDVNLISLYTDKGVVQHSDLTETTGNKAVTADGYKIVKENDIVVNIILCWMGAVGRSAYNGVTSPAYDVYKPINDTNSRYYHYLFRTSQFNGECYRYGRGIMLMRWRTYSTEFRSISVPLPPMDEQQRIVEFLDKKISDVDKLIVNVQKQIEKLKDYKQSLITEVVTKGLDATVTMKESGVATIGEIPTHWTMRKFKTLATLCNGKEVFSEEGNIPVYGSGGIFKWTNVPLHSGESLLMGRKGTIDNPMLVTGDFWTVDTMFYTSQFIDVIGKYLFYCCKGVINYGYFKSGSVLPSMTQTDINNIFLPYAPKKEQNKIVVYLDQKCAQIEQLVNIKQSKIEKLEQYKRSLIYEYVTGKKEVS